MMTSAPNITAGLINERNSNRGQSRSNGLSVMGFSKKKKGDPSRKHNIDKIKSMSGKSLPAEFHYKPKVSQNFLEEWLDFPVDRKVSVLLNSGKMWLVWLIWTSKAMAGLDPGDTSVRARVCSQISVLGTAAGLLLVIAMAGFLVPPELRREEDRIYLDIFGCLMFAASVSLIFYIGVALTCLYPLIESLRDDVAFDAYENYQNRVGGYEVYLFFVGMQLVLAAMFVAAKILYSNIALYVMCGITLIIATAVTHLSRQIFLALDPISAMHMGLSNNPDEQYRAELMSHFILRKIPNTLLTDDTGEDIFVAKHESVKYEQTKRDSLKLRKERDSEGAENDEVRSFGGDAEEMVAKVPFSDVGEEKPKAIRENRVAPEPQGDGMAVTDLDAPVQAAAAVKYKPTASGEAWERGRTTASANSQSALELLPASRAALEPLRDMFAEPESYRFKSVGLSLAESTAALTCLMKAGCTSTEELVAYLDDHKQPRACSCGKAEHTLQCATRQAGAWTAALVSTGIPVFHARKIVLSIKSFLA